MTDKIVVLFATGVAVVSIVVQGEVEDVTIKAVVDFNGIIAISDIHAASKKKCGVFDFIVANDLVATLQDELNGAMRFGVLLLHKEILQRMVTITI